MIFETAGIFSFLKVYVPVLVCGVFISSLETGAGWIYLLGRPTSLIGLLFHSTLIFVVSSFVIGSCLWAFLFLTKIRDMEYRSAILGTLVTLVLITTLKSV